MFKYKIYIALNENTDKPINKFKDYLLARYGGFTQYSTNGYYKMDEITMIEKTMVFEVLTSCPDTMFKSDIKSIFYSCGEESILFSEEKLNEIEFILL